MKNINDELAFEDALSEDWSRDLELVEVRLDERPARYVWLVIALLVALVAGRVLYLNLVRGGAYAGRAEANVFRADHIPAPRGEIIDRFGKVIAANRSVFRATLVTKEFVKRPALQEETLTAIERTLALPREAVLTEVRAASEGESSEPIILKADLTQTEVVALRAVTLPTLKVVEGFLRRYEDPFSFSSLLGYVSLPNAKDLAANPALSSQDFVGKAGVEMQYDAELQGKPGVYLRVRDARGDVVHEEEKSKPKIGDPLELSIDAEFQAYFTKRLSDGLASLGRDSGGAVAMDPRTGEVLALVSLPSFDGNIMSAPGHNEEKRAYLTSDRRPLFHRMIGGNYNPASTVKPLVATAGLVEGTITPETAIYSPGYLDVPNPYDPEKPTRFVDWRPQGMMSIYTGIAFSSNVYFYTVGGGAFDIKGLGITRLKAWWERFGFGKPSGIDFPGEAKGFLPDEAWKERTQGRPWLLGDTYNASIGQGDLSITPIQLVNYIAAIANGGKLYRPTVRKTDTHEMIGDLTQYADALLEVRRGMHQTIVHPRGTATLMSDLPFYVGAKTGSAQISNKTKENAFFAGYATRASRNSPAESAGDPEIVILILVEDSVIGGVNTTPIAKDVLRWYYEHRMQ